MKSVALPRVPESSLTWTGSRPGSTQIIIVFFLVASLHVLMPCSRPLQTPTTAFKALFCVGQAMGVGTCSSGEGSKIPLLSTSTATRWLGCKSPTPCDPCETATASWPVSHRGCRSLASVIILPLRCGAVDGQSVAGRTLAETMVLLEEGSDMVCPYSLVFTRLWNPCLAQGLIASPCRSS
jgi:hypothetical protein